MDERTTTAGADVEPLSWRTIGYYAGAAAGPNFLFYVVLVMYLYYSTVKLGASPAIVGMAFLVCRVWDAVSDPMIGFLSDRTRSRFGRRRTWLVASAPLFLVFSWMLWSPPEDMSPTALSVWIAVAVFGFYTVYTAFDIPHMALGAELSFLPAHRNRVFGARSIVRSIATLAAFTGGVYIVTEGSREVISTMGIVLGVFIAVTLVWCMVKLPPERLDFQARTSSGPIKTVLHVWKNPHARLIFTVVLIENIGSGAIASLIPFMVQYVLHMAVSMSSAFFMLYAVLQLLSIPVWVWLASRFEKRRLWVVATLMCAVAWGSVMFLREGGIPLYVASMILSGIGTGCGFSIGMALKADVVDVDEYHTGERKEGAYFAAWAFVQKLGGALMIGVAGIVLEFVGFDRDLAEQTPNVQLSLVLLYGLGPAIFWGFAGFLLSRFSLSEVEHRRIRDELDQGKHADAKVT